MRGITAGSTLLIMSIHHLDTLPVLFGDPESVYASARTDPRTSVPAPGRDRLYILEYANGLRAAAWDDVWAGPAREGGGPDIDINGASKGTDGLAQGTIGWPGYPNAVPSTIDSPPSGSPGAWIAPQWNEAWFPDAFEARWAECSRRSPTERSPLIGGADNLNTMALVDACYRCLDEHRPVKSRRIHQPE